MLASCSDYFRAMFTDAMLESRQSEICLNGVSATGISLLLDYVYTSRLALTLANVQDVLSAASHVQLLPVVEACSNYLQVYCICCSVIYLVIYCLWYTQLYNMIWIEEKVSFVYYLEDKVLVFLLWGIFIGTH